MREERCPLLVHTQGSLPSHRSLTICQALSCLLYLFGIETTITFTGAAVKTQRSQREQWAEKAKGWPSTLTLISTVIFFFALHIKSKRYKKSFCKNTRPRRLKQPSFWQLCVCLLRRIHQGVSACRVILRLPSPPCYHKVTAILKLLCSSECTHHRIVTKIAKDGC